jgi:hypothetical protein
MEESTISVKTISCLRLFKQNDERLKEEAAAFKRWSLNISAHRKDCRSLEYRLRDSSHLNEGILRLVERLERQLRFSK